MATDVQAILKLVVKYGPKLVKATTLVAQFLIANPAIPNWLRDHLDDLPDRLKLIQKQHGDAAKIRGMLGIIRDVSGALQAHDESTVEVAAWLHRADKMELAVRLAEAQPRSEGKKTLKRLLTETGDLLAELLEATTKDASELASEPSRG